MLTSQAFPENAARAIADDRLRAALGKVREGFGGARRQAAVDRLPEFEALRDAARDIKDHAIAHLDLYLERFERRVEESGGRSTGARPRARPATWCCACAGRSTPAWSPRARP